MRTWLVPARRLAWVALAAASTAMAQEAPRAPASASAPQATAAPAPAAPGIAGSVFVSPHLQDQVRLGDTLFIVARAAGAGRMPVAVLRLQVRSLPVRFSLDDANAMTPELSLSRYPSVSVEARISRSGNAIRQPGDLFGRPVEARVGRSDLQLVIDQVLR
jgi:cytochrome c-type biogenesis protein CcmH